MGRIKFFIRNPTQLLLVALSRIPYFNFIRDSAYSSDYITFSQWFTQKIIGKNREAYWPVHSSSKVVGVHNIYAGIDTNPGFKPGCYIQGTGKLHIGDYTRIAMNVGIMSGSHEVYNHKVFVENETIIGEYCWIGMNSVILPGVKLGDFTKVGAGSVVTKSFPDGYCIIAGNPAKLIKSLDPAKCIRYSNKIEYYGYIKKNKFALYRRKYLKI